MSYADEQWMEIQQLIARVESGAIPLNGVNWQQPGEIWTHQFAIEEKQGQGYERDQAAQMLGWANHDHFQMVMAYVQGKWSRVGTNDDGQKDVLTDDRFTNGAMEARMAQMRGMQSAAAAGDPNLLAPVNGITVEAWAGCSATLAMLGQSATPQQVAEAMAKFGMDNASYAAANAGWQAKMQGDTTGVIATKFGEGFAAAQGMSASSGPPCTFEHFVEVMAAMGCWAEQGIDVNAQLQATFGIDAATYSKYGSYWSPKMATDMAMMRQYSELDEKFRAKYKGAGMDDDLSL